LRLYLTPIAVAACVIGLSVFAITRWSDDLVNRTLLGHAESSALTWRTKLVTSVPEFERLFEAGTMTPRQRELLDASLAGSDIFRFEAFARDGTLTYLSDEALFEVEPGEAFNATSAEVGRSGEMIVTVEDGRTSPDRPDRYVEAYLPIADARGAVVGVVEVYVDVTALAEALGSRFNRLSLVLIGVTAAIYLIPTLLLIRRTAQLRDRDAAMLRLSRQDPLTGLLNRGAFNDRVAEILAPRTGTRDTVGIMFIDVDKFKDINDTYGHDVGDQLLQHVARLMAAGCREEDVLARLGGDEFVILCPGIGREDFLALGQRILRRVHEAPFACRDSWTHARLSVGMHLSEPGETERRALHCADLALYQAKANGRAQVAVYSAETELKDLRRRAVARDVQGALAEGRFHLVFQPIFEVGGPVAGFEALLRLRSADGEAISPAEFVPIAEEAGLINEIGQWVLSEAIGTAALWPERIFITINVSALQFRGGTLLGDLQEAVAATGISPGRICLELTERILIEDQDSVAEQLADIKGLGAEIAIDDFGTGYSSLSYLWQYEFNKLKIDRSFFEAYAFDRDRNARLIETIIDLGHQLDMTVIMEGVETKSQIDFLKGTRCDFAQGFHLGLPMAFEDADALASGSAGPERVRSGAG
jgi:diguanylate cyclase (GGDEF)-like protein